MLHRTQIFGDFPSAAGTKSSRVESFTAIQRKLCICIHEYKASCDLLRWRACNNITYYLMWRFLQMCLKLFYAHTITIKYYKKKHLGGNPGHVTCQSHVTGSVRNHRLHTEACCRTIHGTVEMYLHHRSLYDVHLFLYTKCFSLKGL